MTPSELKYKLEETGKHPYFFSRDNMKYFGDTMKNYGCRKTTINGVEAWELWRKRPVKRGLKNSAYFNAKTFERIFNHD